VRGVGGRREMLGKEVDHRTRDQEDQGLVQVVFIR
jgi:hypothetical protein